MTIQAETRADDAGGIVADDTPRFGFTLTKKVGNAVVRNRARRRLREAVRLAPEISAKDGHDYVIIGRIEAVRLPFAALQRELARGVVGVHERGKRRDAAFEPRKVSAPHKAAKSDKTAKSPGRPAPERIRPVS